MDPALFSWPKAFSSAYRLALRALSASVRHNPMGTKCLRRLYRPAFREAAQLYKAHDANPSQESEKRLEEWNIRLNRTLELLLSSATTSGQFTRFVRNVSLLTDNYHSRVHADKVARERVPGGKWTGQDLARYLAGQAKLATQQKKQENESPTSKEGLQRSSWSALGELVRLAEDDVRILLGRLETRKLGFQRLTWVRNGRGGPPKNRRKLVNYVRKTSPRPRDLKS